MFLGVPVESVMAGAAHRTTATVFHDVAEDKHTSKEEAAIAWQNTEDALVHFYTELLSASKRA